MAATVKTNIRPLASTGNVVPAREKGFIAASQGILIPNSLMYLSQSGTWKACDSSDGSDDVYHATLDGLVDTTLTWPLAAEQAANVEIWVRRLRTDIQYEIYVENNDSDSAAAQAIVGNDYGIRIATGSGKVGYATLDINEGTNTCFVVDDVKSNRIPVKFTTSTSPGVAIGHFLNANIDEERS